MKLGIYGGTFSPPHVGHLIVATAVREQLALEQVVFVPGAVPPHKTGQEIVAGEHRLAMLRLAVEGDPGLGVRAAVALGILFLAGAAAALAGVRPRRDPRVAEEPAPASA
jgi:cytidyltransferase-like protein